MVECNLAKVDVEGSNPFSRSENLNDNDRLEALPWPVFSFWGATKVLEGPLTHRPTSCFTMRTLQGRVS